MEQAIPGMKLVWQAYGEKFLLVVLTAGGEVIFQFQLDRTEVQGMSAEIDRYLLHGNGARLHLPPGVG